MFDGLLSRGFTSKCKSLIKPTKMRIDALRRRAEAKQRFLKEDLAKLLTNGLDINAYGRTEEFLAGLNLLSSYDYIEQLCDYIVKQLSTMQKQSECPEECREVVASLMFAAARFSDLPELRDLRDVFQQRYGNSLEYFVNQKFVEKLSSKSPTVEKRVQLLQDIALEFSIKWDSYGFEQRMGKPSPFVQEQPKKYGPSHAAADKYKVLNGKDGITKTNICDVSSTEKSDIDRDGCRISDYKEGNSLRRDQMDFKYRNQDSNGNRHKPLMTRKETIPEENKNDISFQERRAFIADRHESSYLEDTTIKAARAGDSSHGKRWETIDDGFKLHSDGENIVHKGESQNPLFRGRPEVSSMFAGTRAKNNNKDVSLSDNDCDSQNSMHSTRKGCEEETGRLKSYYNTALPPPYVKLKDNIVPPPYIKSTDSKHEASKGFKHADSDSEKYATDPSQSKMDVAVNGFGMIQKEPQHSEHKKQGSPPARANGYSHEKGLCYKNDIPLPKPRSIRKKHSKSSSSHDDVGHFEGEVAKRSSRRREHSRRGLQNLLDDKRSRKDEEERMIDKLLLHYSRKPSTYDMENLGKKPQAHPLHQIAPDAGESSSTRSRDVHYVNLEKVTPHTRSVSLPHEQASSSETKKVFTRANSFQPDNQARHVHPKLPDYDDLAARFAALRGR